ncbi:nucleotidyltransferase-like protein [Ferdinandcohnia quinoae]|uniref:Nucleotidyltransferase-like protein n=1 Tax=Fredinandcohnia quinoae TaxID=2918902 RepID=A0AAW5EDV4_9BACI|nr:nucleotidyltransferase-like protein [Fredinandcohnia sp. SECRCQ15]MCH1627910.1 nucleotidyltransferase-like protein [Fredinandcohnia sp. SECRCQ15]
MEDLLRPIYQERASNLHTLGIIMIEKSDEAFPITDTFNSVLLVIVKESQKPFIIKHYESNNGKATLYTVTDTQLKEWLLLGSNRKVIDWILNGRVMFDRNDYIEDLKKELYEFPTEERQIKMGVEFAKLIRRYQDGKAFFELKHNLDAYNYVIHALHHLARLAVIEKGFHPEVTVWNQVKQIDPQIHKLYVELVESEESLEKRLELLFLASEFLIHSRVRLGGSHLINVLSENEDSWLYGEIMEHPDLQIYSVDLEVFIEFLVEKHLLEVELMETKGQGIYHRKYKISK